MERKPLNFEHRVLKERRQEKNAAEVQNGVLLNTEACFFAIEKQAFQKRKQRRGHPFQYGFPLLFSAGDGGNVLAQEYLLSGMVNKRTTLSQ